MNLPHRTHVEGALNEFSPHFVVYNAGTDIMAGDSLGLLSITAEVGWVVELGVKKGKPYIFIFNYILQTFHGTEGFLNPLHKLELLLIILAYSVESLRSAPLSSPSGHRCAGRDRV